jgi:hypothetical protein
MQLVGVDRARYFVPTAICIYLASLCAALIVTSAFLDNLQSAVALCATGLIGLLLSGGLGYLSWRTQRLGLQFTRVATPFDARSNFEAVRWAARHASWRILLEDPARRLEAQTSGSLLSVGERIAVQFRGADVLVASICDPSVGFSLVGRRHCAEHRELVRRTVLAARPDVVGDHVGR